MAVVNFHSDSSFFFFSTCSYSHKFNTEKKINVEKSKVDSLEFIRQIKFSNLGTKLDTAQE